MSIRECSLALLVVVTVVLAGPVHAGFNLWTSQGPGGGTVRAVAVDPQNPSRLYAGAGDNIYRSIDGGATWSSGIGLEGAVVNALAIDPQIPTTLYAGTRRGVFKSINSGLTWVLSLEVRYVENLAIDPLHSSSLYATSNEGLYRTTDGGATWEARNHGLPYLWTYAVEVAPTTPSVVYASTVDEVGAYAGSPSGGVVKTTDGGGTWFAANQGLPGDYVADLAVDPMNADVIYAATYGSGVYKTTDAGASWVAANQGISSVDTMAVMIDPSNPQVVYAATYADGTYKSMDGGLSWTAIHEGLTNLAAWSLAIDPQTPGILYAGTGGGLFRTTAGGASWSALEVGLSSIQVNAVAIDPWNSATVYAATWGAGVFKTTDAGLSWTAVNTGLTDPVALDLAIDDSNPSTVYVSTFQHGVLKSVDGGESWTEVNNGLPTGTLDNPFFALAIDPQTPSTLYAGASQLYQSTDGGESWTPIYTAGVRTLAIDPADPDTLYVGSRGVFKSTDGGTTWTSMNTGPPMVYGRDEVHTVQVLVIDPAEPSTVYAGTFGAGILKSTDGGVTWTDNRDFATLAVVPDGTIHALALDPVNPSTVYAGANGQVYRSLDGAATWAPFGEGMTQVGVRDLAVAPSGAAIYAGTYRGVFDYQAGGVFISDPCIPDAKTLCIDDALGDRRFRIRVRFATAMGGGAEGSAGVAPLKAIGADQGGVMYFFAPRNPEMLVKVLNGCKTNGHFWVFAAAATSVGFELEVKDTATGYVKTYNNPDQSAAVAITDAKAFATCDR